MLNILQQQAQVRADVPFLNDLTFSQTLAQVKQLTPKVNRFIQADERVALLANNTPASALLMLSLALLHKQIFLLNPRLTPAEIQQQVTDLKITKIISPDQTYLSYETIFQAQPLPTALDWEFPDEAIAFILNTSATTGKMKSVPIRWRQIKAHVQASAQALGVTPNDNWLMVLPLCHVSGLSILWRSLYNGTSITLMPKYQKEQVVSLMNSGQVNLVSLVPTILKELLPELKDQIMRVILLGGEFIPDNLITQALAKKLPVHKTYGMTEAFSQQATFNILKYPTKHLAVGKALPGVEFQIQQPDDQGIGEIIVNSPMLMTGYLGFPELSGSYHTGDIGYLDQDNFLYILNRRKDLIISGGENIYPLEIENLIASLPDVSECAVVPQADAKWGQVPVLFVAGTINKTKLQKYLADNLARYKVPKQIIYVDHLPRNATGKILRRDLIAQLARLSEANS